MNVCTDFPNSQAVQVVFISTIPNKSGNSRVFPSSGHHMKGPIAHVLPPLLVAYIMKTTYGYGFVSLFIQNPIKQAQPCSAVPPPCLTVLPAKPARAFAVEGHVCTSRRSPHGQMG